MDRDRFKDICALCSEEWKDGGAIGTYNEKRLHMILKRFFCSDTDCYEVKVGNYVADIVRGGRIIEIQTGHLYPLKDKLRYYLEETEYQVKVVYPVMASKRILRVERDTGEVIRVRRSPKHVGYGEIMREMYSIADYLKNERLEIEVLYISADEHRYSDERYRYRKSGKFDCELFPQELIKTESFCGAADFKFLLEGMPDSFSAKEYASTSGLRGRQLYSVLNLLCSLDLLVRRKGEARAYEYSKIN